MKMTVRAIGRARGAAAEMVQDYAKRMVCDFSVRELTAASQKAEAAALLKGLSDKAFVVVLDERGRDLSSIELAAKIETWREKSDEIVFIIGGADGIEETIRARADFMLGLGHKTWPHMLARIMLVEQLYRAQQIASGHPYHRA